MSAWELASGRLDVSPEARAILAKQLVSYGTPGHARRVRQGRVPMFARELQAVEAALRGLEGEALDCLCLGDEMVELGKNIVQEHRRSEASA